MAKINENWQYLRPLPTPLILKNTSYNVHKSFAVELLHGKRLSFPKVKFFVVITFLGAAIRQHSWNIRKERGVFRGSTKFVV